MRPVHTQGRAGTRPAIRQSSDNSRSRQPVAAGRPARAPGADPYRRCPVRSRNATIALYVGGFMGPFGGAVLGVLVPELQESFHATRDAVAASIPAYLIPFAALQLVSGTIGERLGVTRVVRTGFIAYAVGSLIAAAAPDADHLRGRALRAGRVERVPDAAPAGHARRARPAAPAHARDGHVRERPDRRALARSADRRPARDRQLAPGVRRQRGASPSRSRCSPRAPRAPSRRAGRARA